MDLLANWMVHEESRLWHCPWCYLKGPLILMGLSNHVLRGQPLAISLAVINLPFIAGVGISQLLTIIGIVMSELGVGNVVNRLSRCETFSIEGTHNKACNAAPFTLQFWEGTSTYGGSL